MLFAGIDAGSNTIKTVLLDENTLAAAHVIKTGIGGEEQALRCLDEACATIGVARGDIHAIYCTGYGREYVGFPQGRKSEIICHAAGIHWLLPDVRSIIDIGGQDSKAIRLNERGDVQAFNMNDKCAAGTGRFLETMAAALAIPLEDLGGCALTSTEPVRVSSTCTVFAETEVVSHVARGRKRNDILMGVCQSIVDRIAAMARGVGVKAPLAMAGGVAKNPAVVKLMGERLGVTVLLPPDPQITGALGAALLARRDLARPGTEPALRE